MYQYNKKIQKMNNFNDDTEEQTNELNLNWPQIPDHLYRVLIIGVLIIITKYFNDSKAFIKYLNNKNNIYKNIEK